ncbi:hypothetical protein GUJ93_ZPchr0001g32428 [Zizania palustris]|uniref:DUF630 domain-containing protein n=1 Tax=Zizania palustris TaxID=103762 RepID=A0A8J5SAP5_ZIZPA|nr:hypothetical protein GUJ93_ZPchr0001g32428 [Zizania palustris]
MGCTTSHDAFAAAAAASRAFPSSSSSRPGRRTDPASLCRERAALIRAAADRRFALASAHAAYFRSLAAVGDALRLFAATALVPTTPPSGSSPVLTLPPSPAKPVDASATAARSSLPPSPSSSSTVSPLSHSLSDVDLEAHCDAKHAGGGGGSGKATSSTRYHYMRNSPTEPNVRYYEDSNAQYTQGETSYGYGHTYPYGPFGEVVAEERPESAPRPPGPPPSPPIADVSMWDFFDPFTSYDQFLEEYSPDKGQVDGSVPSSSPNYAELRRMEGIPDLEDEAELEASTSRVVDQSGKGKRSIPSDAGSKGEASGGKLQRKGFGANVNPEKPASSTSNKGDKNVASFKGSGSGDVDSGSSIGKKKAVAFDDKAPIAAVVEGDGGSGKSSHSIVSSESFSPLHQGKRDVMEAMDEVKERFDEAMNCGAEVSRLLEVGKVPHHTSTPRVLRYFSSKVMDPLALTVPASSCLPKPHRKSRPSSGNARTSSSSVADRRNSTGNLSSTLEKLCVWEKKLCQEIKVVVLG